jgi:hypothetical protein
MILYQKGDQWKGANQAKVNWCVKVIATSCGVTDEFCRLVSKERQCERCTLGNNSAHITRCNHGQKWNFEPGVHLFHDNAPVHLTTVAKAAMKERGFQKIDYPPYSPDLASSDYYLARPEPFELHDVLGDQQLCYNLFFN